MSLLLDHGANIEAVDIDGDTPLINACRFGEHEKVLILLSHGANIEATNHAGQTALTVASPQIASVLFEDLRWLKQRNFLLFQSQLNTSALSYSQSLTLVLNLEEMKREISHFL